MLHSWLTKHGSFPKGERPEPYQEYYWDGAWRKGQREVVNRAKLMGYDPKPGDAVLELGSQMGGFLQMAVLAGATWVEGIELDSDYIMCANTLLEPISSAEQHVSVSCGDISLDGTLQRAKQRAPEVIDHLILASLGKHIGGAKTLERILKTFDNAKNIYFETNAVKDVHIAEEAVIEAAGGTCVGHTSDRNHRRLWRITR